MDWDFAPESGQTFDLEFAREWQRPGLPSHWSGAVSQPFIPILPACELPQLGYLSLTPRPKEPSNSPDFAATAEKVIKMDPVLLRPTVPIRKRKHIRDTAFKGEQSDEHSLHTPEDKAVGKYAIRCRSHEMFVELHERTANGG